MCQESNTLESVNGELWRLLAVGAAEFVEKNKYIDLINQNRKQYAEDHSDWIYKSWITFQSIKHIVA